MQIKSLERELQEQLRFLGTENLPTAHWLLEHYTGKDAFFAALNPTAEVPEEVVSRIRSAVSLLRTGCPLQYILGEAWFYGLPFAVDERVLIPRPETEELLHWILQDLPPDSEGRAVDFCTGSGCIAIAMAHHRPHMQITATDISEGALQVARSNAHRHRVSVRWLQDDLLSSEVPAEESGRYVCIVSNPPYVMEKEKSEMSDRVKKHEPSSALFVPDEDPLCFYRAIALKGKQLLMKNGCVYVEINEKLGKESQQLFAEAGYGCLELRKDMQGKDRMLKACWKGCENE